MKIGNRFGQKLRYGSASLAITAAVLAVVVLFNVAVSALFVGQRWFIDMTPDRLYTLSDDAERVLGETIDSANETRDENDPVKVDIIFCADPDILCKNSYLKAVYYTALDLQKAYPDTVTVSTRDVWGNPSSVDEYRVSAHSSIYQTNVIIASGTEFRVYNARSFYLYDEDSSSGEPWAYNGEKILIKAIMAVTRAEAPLCALTTNHGEPFATAEGRAKYSEFVKVLERSGYDVIYLDLSKDAIPADCRLIVVFDPVSDFTYGADVNELSKLESFLRQTNSLMVFADADTPKLPNLEEFLEPWGVKFQRIEGANYEVVDPDSKLDGEGTTIVGQYETNGMGSVITKDLVEKGGSPKVIFKNAMPIAYSDTYRIAYQPADEKTGEAGFSYGDYYKNRISRKIFDIFTTTDAAFAYAKDQVTANRVTGDDGQLWKNADAPFKLMTVSRQMKDIAEGTAGSSEYLTSYVCAFGSTEFASNDVLSRNTYGNTDVLLETLRMVGREVELLGLDFKPLHDPSISTDHYAPTAPVVWTVVLILLPAITCVIGGCVVLVKRKNRS